MGRFFNMFFTLILAGPALGSNLEREQQWAEQIRAGLVIGDEVMLQTGSREFFSIYTEAEGKTRGGVILLHGLGVHPDWPDVIHPLRTGLPEHGWATLALQMPLADRHAPFRDYLALLNEVPPRIQAGVDYLTQQGITNIVLIGHSLGAVMGLYDLTEAPQKEIRAFVAIGLSTDPQGPRLQWLKKLKLPMLDLYGERDLPGVVETAKLRRRSARIGKNPAYRQRRVAGADHFFHDQDNVLVKIVWGWLVRTVAGSEDPRSRGQKGAPAS